MKRIILFALLATIVSTISQAQPSAEAKIDGIYYKFSPFDGVEVTYIESRFVCHGPDEYYSDCSGRIVIPNTVNYEGQNYAVTRIDRHAFSRCNGITSVTIPKRVRSIGSDAFEGCHFVPDSIINNSSIVNGYPWGAKVYDGDATETVEGLIIKGDTVVFCRPGATSVTIPNSVTCIGASAFKNRDSLTSITIPNNVESIGRYAFASCSNLTSVTIPESVTNIGEDAFRGCRDLKAVHISDLAAWCNIKFDGGYDSHPLNYAHHLYLNGEKITDLVIPNGVTSISDYAFYDYDSLKSVTIPNSVTSIGKEAFKGCDNLTTINIPKGVKSIGDEAFAWCGSLSSVILSKSVTSISISAFAACNKLSSIDVKNSNPKYDSRKNCNAIIETASNTLIFGCQSTSIPNDVTSIGASAFSGCDSLTSITIPNSVTSIGESAFEYCRSLTAITIPNSVTSISESAFNNCDRLSTITIPNSVTSIGVSAFAGCNSLTAVTIPNSVTSISESAFRGCDSLTAVTIPNSVTSIGASAFMDCCSLTAITIPNSVEIIDDYAFAWCRSLTSVKIPESVTSIGKGAFEYCDSLKAVHISDLAAWCNISFKDLYEHAHHLFLNGEEITDLVIPNGVKRIRNYAFSNCRYLTSVTFPNSMQSIGVAAFNDCVGLTSVTIPDSVKNIAKAAFYGCTGLKSVTIPDGVKSIGVVAFAWCRGLSAINIPKSVTSIGEAAFKDCSNLSLITIPDGVTSIDKDAFSGTKWYDNQPDGIVYAGRVAYNYKGEMPAGTKIAIKERTVKIMDNTFNKCLGLTSITIPNSVASIGKHAFSGCDSLKAVHISDLAAWCNISFDDFGSQPLYYARQLFLNGEKITDLVIPDGVTSINEYAFAKCKNLTSITIPSSVTSIGESAFSSCDSLTAIDIPNSVTSIGASAFNGCSSLTAIDIPNSVTSIGASAFNGCSSLTTIDIPNSVDSIGDGVFAWCGSLTSVTIPNSVDSIGDGVFAWCGSLTSVTIPNSLTSIGKRAFEGCKSLTSVTIPENVTNIGEDAFRDCYFVQDSIINKSTMTSSEAWGATVYNGNSIEKDGCIIINNDMLVKCRPKVTSVTIPSCIKAIRHDAFGGCYNLKAVNISDLAAWCNISFPSQPLNYAHQLFLNGEEITNLVIPDGVTSIGNYAFSRCNGLTSVTIPSSVTSIGEDAFKGCDSLKTIHISDLAAWCNIKFDGGYDSHPLNFAHQLFLNGEKISDLVIPDGVTSIGNYAFYGCKDLTSVTIPESVTNIGESAFQGCFSLKAVHISNLAAWCNIKFNDYSSQPLKYAHQLFLNGERITDLVIPNGVTSIGNYTFWCDCLKSVTIPNSVTSIGERAFISCESLTSVTIPESVTNIGENAFKGCYFVQDSIINKSSITSNDAWGATVYNGNSIETDDGFIIRNDTLIKCRPWVTSVTIPQTVKCIGDEAFWYCRSLTSVTIPQTVKCIGNYSFCHCESLTSVTIPSSVTRIGNGAFSTCTSLTSFNIPKSVTSIGGFAFHWSKWEDNQPDGLIYIGRTAYSYKQRKGKMPEGTHVKIKEGTQEIAGYAFSNCKGLTCITIPKSMRNIGRSAFQDCNNLTSITCKAIVPPACEEDKVFLRVFLRVDKEKCTLYVPKGCMEAYKNAAQWQDFKNIIEMKQ